MFAAVPIILAIPNTPTSRRPMKFGKRKKNKSNTMEKSQDESNTTRDSNFQIPTDIDIDKKRYNAILAHVQGQKYLEDVGSENRQILTDLFLELVPKVNALRTEEERERKEIETIREAFRSEQRDIAMAKALVKGSKWYAGRSSLDAAKVIHSIEGFVIGRRIKAREHALEKRVADKEKALIDEFKARRLRLIGRPDGIEWNTKQTEEERSQWRREKEMMSR